MKTRSLGISFIAAVIVPSILLAVLSIRSAGREEAWLEKQVATTLDAEVTHAAGLADTEVGRVVDELRSSLDVPAGSDYGRILGRWKTATPLVAVPYVLSPRYGILWPPSDSRASANQKRFLKENGDFLGNRAPTSVLQNIAVKYQGEILSEARPREERAAADKEARAAASKSVPAPSMPAPPAPTESTPALSAPARQMAIDAFAQSPSIQSKVYGEARAKGEQLNARVVSPEVQTIPGGVQSGLADMQSAQAETPTPPADNLLQGQTDRSAAGGAEVAGPAPSGPAAIAEKKDAQALRRAAEAPAAPATIPPTPSPAAPSQFVLASQLLSQISSQGDYGIIPRFVANPPGASSADRLEFLFWARQKDGQIAGCQIDAAAFRSRIAGVLESTWTPVRILTLLDENGVPLAAPPDSAGRDWHRPFVAREIGERLPRWEAAAYLTRPDVISSQARSSSLVIWVLVMILFVSVAGGGVTVLSSVYAGMRVAQQKATFVTNVSHELKTPLTSISLFIDLLRRKGSLSAAKKEQYLSLMASETERLTRLINNVLDFSRDKGARRYAMQTVDAAEVARQIVESQRVRLESSGFVVDLKIEADPQDAEAGLTVRADPEALKQVLLNLLSNAEKYSRQTRELAVRAGRDATEVTITVADRGIGVPEKERQKIFQEFYRVDDSLSSGVQGTGLGLSIARRIARDHGGDITCAPRPGGGSEFTVRLPAASEEAEVTT